MNWSIQYNDSPKHVKITCNGNFTIHDWIAMKENLLAQPFWRPGLDAFFDYRKTDFKGLRLEDLRYLAEKHVAEDARIGGGKTALLMGSTRDFGLGRQYEMLMEAKVASKIMVFLDEAAAFNWLDSGRESTDSSDRMSILKNEVLNEKQSASTDR